METSASDELKGGEKAPSESLNIDAAKDRRPPTIAKKNKRKSTQPRKRTDVERDYLQHLLEKGTEPEEEGVAMDNMMEASSSPEADYNLTECSTPNTGSSNFSSKTDAADGETTLRITGTSKKARSYKNLSKARRIVANARERNRVHTISAAFEELRRAVPSYSLNQKLSKLAILRVACCYIGALAKLSSIDYSGNQSQEDPSTVSFRECVELCTQTLQCEGRVKRSSRIKEEES